MASDGICVQTCVNAIIAIAIAAIGIVASYLIGHFDYR